MDCVWLQPEGFAAFVMAPSKGVLTLAGPKEPSLYVEGGLYLSYVRSVMFYGSEIWTIKDDGKRVECAKISTVR